MLELRDVTLAFGEKTVLQGCSLVLGAGEHLALMGPSGCGKTTLLRCALGLQLPDSGTVTCDFQRTAAVFQEPRLLPWRNALDNVLAVTGKAQAARENALQWFEKLEIAEAAALYPEAVSGGALGRDAAAGLDCPRHGSAAGLSGPGRALQRSRRSAARARAHTSGRKPEADGRPAGNPQRGRSRGTRLPDPALSRRKIRIKKSRRPYRPSGFLYAGRSGQDFRTSWSSFTEGRT